MDINNAAAEIGLTIDPAYQAGVQEQLTRLRAVAEFLMEFPLPQDVEPAPVFQP